jgi:effector-binding domain-containing protein
VPNYDIVLKRVEALPVATLRRRVQADHEAASLVTEIYAYLRCFPITYPAPALAVWEDQDRGIDEEGFDVVVAVPINGQATPNTEIEITMLPAIEAMACAVHHGSLEQLNHAYEALHEWSRTNGYRVAGPSRTVYVHMDRAATKEDTVIEVQLPLMMDERLAPFEDLLGTAERIQITERVRQVLTAAHEEARQEANAVQLRHLLIGLLSVEKGLAASVLAQMGVSEARVRGIAPSSVTEPEIVVGGQRWGQAARYVIAQSAMVAHRLMHDYIGTEHLLLALAEQHRPDVQGVLGSLGLTASLVEQAVNERLS